MSLQSTLRNEVKPTPDFPQQWQSVMSQQQQVGYINVRNEDQEKDISTIKMQDIYKMDDESI